MKKTSVWLVALVLMAGLLGGALSSLLLRSPGQPANLSASQPAMQTTGQRINQTTSQGTGSPIEEQGKRALLARVAVLEANVDILQRTLLAEQESMLALQTELQDLQGVMLPVTPEQINDSESFIDPAAENFGEQFAERGYRDPDFTVMSEVEALVTAGVNEDTARALRNRLDQFTLAELEVRDRAAREGWIDSDDYRERRDALLPEPVDLRQELGDQAWDAYLYASGRDNRIRIDSVIDGSAAFVAGFEPGDLVLGYANNPVYSIRELQQATREGQRGEVISVRLGRGSGVFDTTIPRGPLGVTLSSTRQQTAAPGE